MKEFDPEYYKEYLPVIKQQNMIVEIFAMVSVFLETQGIDLLFYEVNFNEEDWDKKDTWIAFVRENKEYF